MGATQKGFLAQERFVLKNTSPLQCVENGFEGLEKFFIGGIFAMWVKITAVQLLIEIIHEKVRHLFAVIRKNFSIFVPLLRQQTY